MFLISLHRNQNGPKKKAEKNRNITTENKFDADGKCSFVVYNPNLYQDSRVITCRQLSICSQIKEKGTLKNCRE